MLDLVGSTAFKSELRKINSLLKSTKDYSLDIQMPVHHWLEAFETFYDSFPEEFSYRFNEHISENQFPTPRIWKRLGDEIIFDCVIKAERHALYLVESFAHAVKTFDDQLKKKHSILRCKGCAWLAGFPVMNVRISGSEEVGRDYIGPGIDLGFRLCKHATPRQLIVSADLAYLLVEASKDDKRVSPRFHYDGGKELKGVLDGVPYPIIWYDLCDQTPEEELLKGVSRNHCNHTLLKNLCEKFLTGVQGACTPFIVGDKSEPIFGSVPKEYTEIRKKLIQRQSDKLKDAERYEIMSSDEEPLQDEPPEVSFDFDGHILLGSRPLQTQNEVAERLLRKAQEKTRED